MQAYSLLLAVFVLHVCAFAHANGNLISSNCDPSLNDLCANHDNCFLPDSNQCSAYIVCINKLGYRFKCPPGYQFDSVKSTCLESSLVNCGSRPPDCGCNGGGGGGGGAVTKPTTPKPTPAPCDCATATTKCGNGGVTVTTPSTPCHIHPTTPCVTHPPHDCTTTPAPCGCSTTTTRSTGQVSIGYHRSWRDCQGKPDGSVLLDRRHCSIYYLCQNEKVKRQKCSLGQWYDQDKLGCFEEYLVRNCLALKD